MNSIHYLRQNMNNMHYLATRFAFLSASFPSGKLDTGESGIKSLVWKGYLINNKVIHTTKPHTNTPQDNNCTVLPRLFFNCIFPFFSKYMLALRRKRKTWLVNESGNLWFPKVLLKSPHPSLRRETYKGDAWKEVPLTWILSWISPAL